MTTELNLSDREEVKDWLAECIDESMDMDWQSSWGAEHILSAMELHGIAFTRTPAPDAGLGGESSPPVQLGELWIERWYGSEPLRGSSIWTTDSIGCHKTMIEHFGGDEQTHGKIRRIVAAHNATISPTAEQQPDVRELVEAAKRLGASHSYFVQRIPAEKSRKYGGYRVGFILPNKQAQEALRAENALETALTRMENRPND